MRNSLKLILALLFVSFVNVCMAQEGKELKSVDATSLRLINRGWDTQTMLSPYTRIPAALKDSVRPDLWDRTLCSSGIGVRFATNSSKVGVRFKLLKDFHMLHMADTGIKGVDLYVYDPQARKWRYQNTCRPGTDSLKMCKKIFVENVDTTQMREYMLYLPLYDGVEQVWVLVDDDADINSGEPTLIDKDKKVVGYGTSIFQGGCASRTGMASSNILSRKLNCEVVNLGFSGEGKMDAVMARAMAGIEDADLYLLDPVPNCTEMMCDTLTYDFVKIIRQARPEAPIVMVEGPIYPYAYLDDNFGSYLPKKNEKFYKNYLRLLEDGYKDIYYVKTEDLIDPEEEGTVDGIHLTDLGFKAYADGLYPLLNSLLYHNK